MRPFALALIVLAGCREPTWCAATYYFSAPDSGWAHPDSVDLSDPDAPAVEPDSVVVEDCET